LLGEGEGRRRLGEVEGGVASDSALAEDIETVRAVYNGTADPDRVTLLEKRHGWFGKLAATYGLPMADEDRRAIAGGGGRIVGMGLTLGTAGLVVLAAAFTLFLIGLVRWASGSMTAKFVPPAPGGSVGFETVAVFVAGFIGLKVASAGVESLTQSTLVAVVFALAAQWSLIAVLFWPMVRGVSAGEAAGLWGLHRGRGILREMGCGIMGYIGLLPLLIAGALASVSLMLLYEAGRRLAGMPEPVLPENPIIDLMSGSTPAWVVVLLGLLASLWAPLVEESIFRGALYRQLRTTWHWLPAALVTALGFGLMHGYPVPLLGPVIALGFGFAFLREWRGSIIASMTAHCLHNTTVIVLLLTVVRFLGG
jgi:membrane protease YdiL (CAAX protease family)